MGLFLDKKMQVYDLKLTSYGHYQLSIGKFKPHSYAFYDDNILYDKTYASGTPAQASYTQIADADAAESQTLILTDAEETEHTMTFTIGAGTTTSALIYNEPAESPAEVTTQILKAIILAKDEGLIKMTAIQSAPTSIELIMDTIGTAGNGETIGGTITNSGVMGGNVSIVTVFAGGTDLIYEAQNKVDNRIKATQYLESQVLFEDVEEKMADFSGEIVDLFTKELTTVEKTPKKDMFKFDMMLGDAALDGDANVAPAWKVAALQTMISSSAVKDLATNSLVPQLNITANYRKTIAEAAIDYNPASIRVLNDRTRPFVDGNMIILENDDPLYYIEELNTQVLVENFEIEVFDITNSTDWLTGAAPTLERKYFRRKIPQIEDGFLISDTETLVSVTELTSASVEYYFDVLVDDNIEQALACKGALDFNKESYYVDLDFDCEADSEKTTYYDIYGSVTEPEICLD